jgi:hypothetical protein
MGSAGFAIVNAFFDSDVEFDTNEARQEFAMHMIEDSRFLYKDTESLVCYVRDYNSLDSDFHFSLSKVSSVGNS